jgi:tryptophanyl-tRNA synthetase
MDPEEREDLRARYRAGGFGYGGAKKTLIARMDRTFGPFRERKKALDGDRDVLEDILRAGAARARAVARETLDDARRACGID